MLTVQSHFSGQNAKRALELSLEKNDPVITFTDGIYFLIHH